MITSCFLEKVLKRNLHFLSSESKNNMQAIVMYSILILFIISTSSYGINADCDLEDSFIKGDSYVIGLYKMYTNYDQNEYDENAIRLHLRLRLVVPISVGNSIKVLP